jgi:hypothetical protein
MDLLQATNEAVADWTSPLISSIAIILIGYGLGAVVLYFIISRAIRSGMKNIRRERHISNRLLGEQMKSQGMDKGLVDSILNSKY